MITQITQNEKALALVEKMGFLRPRDLDPYGIPRSSLSRLHSKGKLKKSGRGLYVLANSHPTEHRSLAEVSKRVPKGVICLLSALRFHELTTESPFQIWMAIGSNAWRPKIEYPPVQIVHFSPNSLESGVERHLIEGVNVPIYSPAKTVADCFKYRNKIGVNIAIEALRECWQSKRCSMDELWHFAGICRVQNVMRPYLESLTA